MCLLTMNFSTHDFLYTKYRKIPEYGNLYVCDLAAISSFTIFSLVLSKAISTDYVDN